MRRSGWIACAAAIAAPACAVLTSFDDLRSDAGADASADVVGGADVSNDVAEDAAIDVVVGDAPLGCGDASDDALELYLRFDEGTGSSIADCSGHNRNGALLPPEADGGSWSTGHVGSGIAVSASGTTGCVDVPLFPNLTAAFTLAAWVRVASYPSAQYTSIIAKQPDNSAGWRLGVSPSMDYAFMLGGITDAGNYQLGSVVTVPLDTWQHIAAVFKPNTSFLVYVNGSQLNSKGGVPSAAVPTSQPLHVGCRSDNNPATYFDGIIDEVRVYSRALSGPEINALYTE